MSATGNNINGVSEINVLSAEQFDALVNQFVSIDWPVTAGDVDALLESWQWQVDERVGDGGIVIDPGYGFDQLDPGWVHLTSGAVTVISVSISDSTEQTTLPDVLRDAFAAQAAAVSARVGKQPDERQAGAKPVAVWLLPSDSRLTLYGSELGNLLAVTSPEHGRLLRDTD